jgi:hypothetical protein
MPEPFLDCDQALKTTAPFLCAVWLNMGLDALSKNAALAKVSMYKIII